MANMFVLDTAGTTVQSLPNTPDLVMGLVGIGLGVLGVAITMKLYYKVKNIEDRRRSEQKQHFKKLITNNVEEMSKLYNSITIISAREQYTEEELEERTKSLHDFFKKNRENIESLIRDTKFYASMLSVVDTPTIDDMNKVIDILRWLTDEFYILDYSVERNMNRWVGKEHELQQNKDFIEKTLSSLNTH